MIRVSATAAINQTKRSETTTAGCVTLTMARVNGMRASNGGAATSAVAAHAASARKTTNALRIDPSRCAAEQKNQRGIDEKKQRTESHLPEHRSVSDRVGGTEDRCTRRGAGPEADGERAQR